jgi:hypothetical protein
VDFGRRQQALSGAVRPGWNSQSVLRSAV